MMKVGEIVDEVTSDEDFLVVDQTDLDMNRKEDDADGFQSDEELKEDIAQIVMERDRVVVAMEKKIKDLHEEMSILVAEKKRLLEENMEQQDMISVLKDEKDGQELQIAELENDNEDLERILIEKCREKDEMEKKSEDMHGEMSNLLEEREELLEENSELRRTINVLNKKMEDIGKLRIREKFMMAKRIADLNGEKSNLLEEKKQLLEETSEQQCKINELKQEQELKIVEVESNKEGIATVRMERDRVLEEKFAMEKKMEDLLRKKSNLLEDKIKLLEERSEQINELKNEKQEQAFKIDELESERNLQSMKIKEMKEDFWKFGEDILAKQKKLYCTIMETVEIKKKREIECEKEEPGSKLEETMSELGEQKRKVVEIEPEKEGMTKTINEKQEASVKEHDHLRYESIWSFAMRCTDEIDSLRKKKKLLKETTRNLNEEIIALQHFSEGLLQEKNQTEIMANMFSQRVIQMLKNTVEMCGSSNNDVKVIGGKEFVFDKKKKLDYEKGIQEFLTELEVIQRAYKIKKSKLEHAQQQVAHFWLQLSVAAIVLVAVFLACNVQHYC